MALHLVKLCVGCDSVEELLQWRQETSTPGQPWILRTRQTPTRATELLAGGSLFRVYRGFILSRQTILDVRTVAEGVSRRCEIQLSETVTATVPTPRRPFQGWRYLSAEDAPSDLTDGSAGADMPAPLARMLREIGVW